MMCGLLWVGAHVAVCVKGGECVKKRLLESWGELVDYQLVKCDGPVSERHSSLWVVSTLGSLFCRRFIRVSIPLECLVDAGSVTSFCCCNRQ